MNAVILAAGLGRRLRPLTDAYPKCLLTFGDKTLLRRHLEMLDDVGVECIVVVVGHLADQVEAEVARVKCGVPVDLVYNPEYDKGNALSLLRAETAYRNKPALIMDADILFGYTMLACLLAAPMPNCLLVDHRLVDTGEEVKVVARPDGRVWELGKQVNSAGRVVGESVGIYKFSAQATRVMTQALRQSVNSDPDIIFDAGINGMLKRVQVEYVDVSDLPWIEIDFPADIDRARREVWPSLLISERSPYNDKG